MSRSPIFSTTLRHYVWIPYFFDSSPTSCLDLLSFQWLSDIMSGSLNFSTALRHCVRVSFFLGALRHCVRIPYHFGGFPTSCPGPLSFWLLSNIVSRSPIILMALRHCVQIPYRFDDSPALCLNSLSLRRLFDIVSGSHFLFNNSSTSCPDPLSFLWLFPIIS